MPTRASLATLGATLTILAATVVRAGAQTTALHFDSQVGDYIGQGEVQTFAPPEATFTVTTFGQNGVSVSIRGPASSYSWFLGFSAPFGAPLTVGTYGPVLNSLLPNQPAAGLSVSGSGRACNVVSGRFDILELLRDGSGNIVSFAADVEQHCEGAPAALFAAFRFNSSIATTSPFGGLYPRFELHLEPAAHGTISGTDITCGGGATACSVAFGEATSLPLTATPDAGYVFTGWTGHCHGGSSTTISVNTVATCGATFAPEPPTAPRTFIASYSEAGEFVGQGRNQFWNPVNSVWRVLSSVNRTEVYVEVEGLAVPRSSSLRVRMTSGNAAPLANGTYVDVANFSPSFLPELEVSGDGGSCAGTGRFEILDAVFASDGSILSFAADIEYHCGDNAPALFIALRYNSDVAGAMPLGGITPRYELTLAPNAHGTVSGGGLQCGTGGLACFASFGAATNVTLTAIPDSGYIFAGWTGSCAGEATTMVRVNSVKSCTALFEPRTPPQPRTLVFIDSQDGDFIGAGQTLAYTPANASIAVSRPSTNAIRVTVDGVGASWRFTFAAPTGETITPGTFQPARRESFTALVGLDISGNSRGCNTLTGRFIVYEVEYGADGSVTRFAADAEQHCENGTPATFAALRINSTVQPTPFGGQYPWYELTIDGSVHGKVTGGPLNCGAGNDSCWVTFLGQSLLTLTATPQPGFAFLGWIGACSGGQTITLNVNTTMRCAALFEPEPPIVPRTVLYWDSTAVDAIGNGEKETYNGANSRWTIIRAGGDNGLDITIDSIAENSASRWTLWFRAPSGQTLEPGAYEGAVRAPFQTVTPGLDVSGNGSGCNMVAGRFMVHEISKDLGGNVTSLAIDFEQSCTTFSGSPRSPLFGALRYNSTVAVPVTKLVLQENVTFPHRYGTPITWAASAHPASGVEYSFWRQAPNGPWTMVQPYSTASVYTWTPTANDLGTHSIQVLARRVGSGAPYEVYSGKSFVVDAGPVPTVTSLTADKTPQVGVPVTWTALATGGIGPLQYQFWRLDSGGWVMARGYASSNQYTWTPTAADVGPHALQVWVRNAGSTNVYDAYRAIAIDVPAPQPVSLSSLTSNVALPAPVGGSITWTALATGGTAPLQYQFWRLSAGIWTIVQPYSSSSTYTWTPAVADAGEHVLQVWVKSAGSTAIYDAWRGLTFAITGPPPVTLTSVTTTSAPPLPAGSAHTWTAVASGGVAPLQYQFWRRDVDGWKLARDWATSPSYTWTPTFADVGSHDLQVWVRNAGTTSGFDAWLSAPSFNVVAPAINLRLVVNATFPLPAGIEVEWGAIASGGIAPLEYQFYRLDADEWKMVQDYSPNAVYRWTPTAADAGTHAIQVFVRGAGSTAVYDAWAGSGVFVINP